MTDNETGRKLNELAEDMERVLALTEETQDMLGASRPVYAEQLRDARRLVRKASSYLARLADQAGETTTEWGVRYRDGGCKGWGDDILGAQRSAEMYRGEHVQRQVGPWTPATPSTVTAREG